MWKVLDTISAVIIATGIVSFDLCRRAVKGVRMRATTRIITVLLALAVTARATPVSIEEFLNQDPQQPTGTVTIVETQECCEDKRGVPWWPFLLAGAGAIPLAFLGDDEKPSIDVQPPAITIPTPDTTPVPEPQTLSLELLAVAGIFVWGKRRLRLP